MGGKRYVYWICTYKRELWDPPRDLPTGIAWIKGQLEIGFGGFCHWQFIVGFSSKLSLLSAKDYFPHCHLEPTRSAAAEAYVWKEDTRVEGTQFEFGRKPVNPAVKTDWEMVWNAAKSGDLERVPFRIRVCNYRYVLVNIRTLRTIASDNAPALPMVRECSVFWGKTGTGKSKRAWEEAGLEAYPKDPRTKFWDGYATQKFVIIDEFRGGIDIAHLLRWLDRYPVRVEIKGSSRPLVMKKCWITSNISPMDWYPLVDSDTLEALIRRLNIIHFT